MSNRFFGTPAPIDSADATTQAEKSNLDMLSETAFSLREGSASPFVLQARSQSPTSPIPSPKYRQSGSAQKKDRSESPSASPSAPIPIPLPENRQHGHAHTIYISESPSESPSASPSAPIPPPSPQTSFGNQSASRSQSPKGEKTASNRVADFFNPRGIFLKLPHNETIEMNFLFERGQINNVKAIKFNATDITLLTDCFSIDFIRDSHAYIESFFYTTDKNDDCYKNITPFDPTASKASFLMDFFIALAALLNCKYIELIDVSTKETKQCSFPLRLNQYMPPFRTYYGKWGYISSNTLKDDGYNIDNIDNIDDYVQKTNEMQQRSLQLSERPISSFQAIEDIKDDWNYIDGTPDSFEKTNVGELCLLLKKLCSSLDSHGSKVQLVAKYKRFLTVLQTMDGMSPGFKKYIFSCPDDRKGNYKTVEMVSMTGTLFEKTKTIYKWSATEQGYSIERVRAKRRSQIFQGYTLDPALWTFHKNFLLCEGKDDETSEHHLFKIYFKFYGNAVIGASETFATYCKSMYGLEYEKTIYDRISSLQSEFLNTHVLTYVDSLKNTSICQPQPPWEQMNPQIRTWLEHISIIEKSWIDYIDCVKATVFVFEKDTENLATYLKSTKNDAIENEVYILFQLLWAIEKLHEKGIVKNNITSDNIYISSTWPASRKDGDIIDFGQNWILPEKAPRVILTDWTLANVEPELKNPQLNPTATKPAKNMLLTPYCDQKNICLKNDVQRDISDSLAIFKESNFIGRYIRKISRLKTTTISNLLEEELFSQIKRK